MIAPTGKIYKLTVKCVSEDKKYSLPENQDECLKYPSKHYLIDLLQPEVTVWLTKQPMYMWKYSEDCNFGVSSRVIVSAELYTWLVMKWA